MSRRDDPPPPPHRPRHAPTGPRRRRPPGHRGIRPGARRPQAGRAAHAGVVHAPGGPVAARVPHGARGRRDARVVPAPRPRHRDHAAAGAPPRGRRRDLLLRHRRARCRRSGSTSTSSPASGPVVARPIRTRADLAQLRDLTPEDVPDITESVRLLTAELGATPLIGFAGAPFTLASYLVEGGPSKNHEHTKALMHGDPQLWHDLCAQLAQISGAFLRVQAEAGASVVQLFDSWAGVLSRADYTASVQQHSAAALAAVADLDVPRIHFGVGTGELLAAHGRGRGRRRRRRLPRLAHRRARPPRRPVRRAGQPRPGAAVRAVGAPRAAGARRSSRRAAAAPGHIFNLGHGVLPETDPDVLTRVVELVHEASAR